MRVQLANAQRRAGKLDEAIETLRAVLRVEPRSAPALNALGMVYEARGQHELADLVLHRALDIDKESKAAADVYNNLGLVALARRRDQEAFADFDSASRLDPSLTVARRNKAMVYLDCGDYARAAEELRAVTKADPTDVEAWNALGVAERGQGKFDAAQTAYEKALAADPNGPAPPTRSSISPCLHMDFKKEPGKARARLDEYLKVAAAKPSAPRRRRGARCASLPSRPPRRPHNRRRQPKRGSIVKRLVSARRCRRCRRVPSLRSVTPATAQKKKAPGQSRRQRRGSNLRSTPKTGQKSKQYTFGGLDIDGKLKTPQLLYFLNRMKSEFDTTAPDKRSFIPELKRSTDEM